MSQNHEYERDVELIDYIEALLKQKWLILGFTVVCVVVAGVAAPKGVTYETEALVVVSQAITTGSKGESAGGLSPGSDIFVPGLSAMTYEALARSDELVRDLRDSLLQSDLSPDALDFVQAANVNSISGMLAAEIVATTKQDPSPLLSFKVTSISEEIAAW